MSYISSQDSSEVTHGASAASLRQLSSTGKLCVSGTASGGKKHFGIVVADEDSGSVYRLTRILRAQGYAVHQATDGLEAVVIAKARQPRVVIMDYSIHDLGGIGASRWIKDVCPGAKIILTARSAQSEQEAKGTGMTILRKPDDIPELLNLLSRLSSCEDAAASVM